MSQPIGNILPNVNSRDLTRLKQLARGLKRPAFRHNYMSRHVRSFLAAQIRALRGDLSQSAFGKKIGKPQSVVSRLEDEGYGKVNISTLLDIAEKLHVALVVRFVDYPTFLKLNSELSEERFAPAQFDEEALDIYVREVEQEVKNQQVKEMFTGEKSAARVFSIDRSPERESGGAELRPDTRVALQDA